MAMGQQMTTEQQLRNRLGELSKTLEQIEAVVSVSVAALAAQSSDRDQDVARVLQRSVADRLSTEIEKTAALLDARPSTPVRKRSPTGSA